MVSLKLKLLFLLLYFRFIGIELSQVSQLLTIGLYLGSLRIYNLSDGRVLQVCILVYRGIIVYNLRVRCALARKINSKTTWVCRTNLVKWVVNKTGDPIKFKRGKESAGFNVVQDLLFSLFRLVLLIQYIIQRLCNSNSPILFNLYTLVI